jgi:hypothetical protein
MRLRQRTALDSMAEAVLLSGGRSSRRLLMVTFVGLIISFAAISSKSYWLDETGVAHRASLPTMGEWWHSLRYGDANFQLPFYHIFARCWASLVGIHEYALRAGNIIWLALGLVVIAKAFEEAGSLFWTIVVILLTSPFVWYYLDEARPYAMQIGASLIVFGALYGMACARESSKEWPWVVTLYCGSVLLAGSGLLAMLWLGAYLLAAAICASKARLLQFGQNYWRSAIITLLVLLVIGVYYLWTLSVGIRTQMVGTTDVRNLPFVAYELLGFSGLGPSRLVIRTQNINAFRPWLSWLAVYGTLAAYVSARGLYRIKTSIGYLTILAWGFSFGVVCIFIVGFAMAVKFRVLGRHFAPVYPLVLFVLATGGTAVLEKYSATGRIILTGFVALSLVSALSLRFNSRHAKDDYRGAALLGSEALQKGEVVWWNADPDGASVYNLTLAKRDTLGHGAHFIMNPRKGFELNLPKPDLVLASKPDVYDQNGIVQEYLSRGGYRPVANLPAFTAWRAPTK